MRVFASEWASKPRRSVNPEGKVEKPSMSMSRNEINTNLDREMPQGPSDTVSCLAWSPNGNFLAVASWDNSVRVYEINPATGEGQGRFVYQHEAPALGVCWLPDGSKVVSGGCDNVLRSYDVASGQSAVVGQHDMPVMGLCIVDVGQPMVASVSLDKTLRYWNLTSPQPVATVQLPERGYAVCSAQKLLVASCANKQAVLINLETPQSIYKTQDSPLKFQTQAVACMPSGIGYALGSIEGRCAIQYLQPSGSNSNFNFRCHRKSVGTTAKPVEDVFPVVAMSFHPQTQSLVTAGSDGMFHIWNTASRRRISFSKQQNDPINWICFNPQGTLLAYATGYDWFKGCQFAKPGTGGIVKVHKVDEWEVKIKDH